MRSLINNRVLALLIVGLLAMQALSIAHAFDHPALDHADSACLVGVHGQGLDTALAPAAASLTITPVVWRPVQPLRQIAVPAERPAPRSRGPPVVF